MGPPDIPRGDAYDDRSPFKKRGRRPFLRRTFPVSQAVSGEYPRRDFRPDAIAGITVAALAIPSAMAYAELAGLSPVAGLYALLLPVLAYVVLGSSRQMVLGPEGALSLLLATSLAPIASGGDYAALAAMVAVLVGGISLVARVVRLGWISDYFSRAVLVGYIHGVAVVLIVGQLGKFFGVSIDAQDPLPQFREFFGELSTIDGMTAAVGVVSLGALLLLRWKAPRLPGALVVVVGAIVASAVFDLENEGVAVVGSIPSGLPSLSMPNVSIGQVIDLLPVAVGIFAVGFADHILTARSFAGRHDQHVDANQELLAFGTANLAAGVTQGFPVGASGSRTTVNDQMGARTQLVGVVSAAVVLVVLLFLTAPFEVLPKAALGAVIVGAAIGLIEPAAWRALKQTGRSQVMIAVATFAGVIIFGVLQALLVAVALSIVDVVARSAKPHDAVLGYVDRLGRYANVTFHPSARVTPGVLVYRLDDRLFFANSRHFKARVREAIAGAGAPVHWFVFDAEGVTEIDASGTEALEQTIRALAEQDVTFVVARAKHDLRSRLDTTGLTAQIGTDHMHPTIDAAVGACTAER
ncbi:MAG TPA: SulP family inorganic anion transporter [Acidimicrobiia bacterium]|nr:SulP family inorganic anion transporter [Acidimicrobiia bacterium]